MDGFIRMLILFFSLLLTFTLGPIWLYSTGSVRMDEDWQTASHEPVGIAPVPEKMEAAVVQVYAARAFNWRGLFSVHTWIAMKPVKAKTFTIYHLLGWNRYHQRPLIDVSYGPPDRLWYGHRPKVILSIEGDRAAELIPKIEAAIQHYPYPDTYHVWPGPNSNTFIAWIGRQVPQLALVMPASAVGKDYLGGHQLIAIPPSGSGFQISLYGVLGLMISLRSGLQLNIAGLVLGMTFWPPTLILPGVGRLSFKQPW